MALRRFEAERLRRRRARHRGAWRRLCGLRRTWGRIRHGGYGSIVAPSTNAVHPSCQKQITIISSGDTQKPRPAGRGLVAVSNWGEAHGEPKPITRKTSARPEYGEGFTAFVRLGGADVFNVVGRAEVFADGAAECAGAVTVQHESHGFAFAEQPVEEGVDAAGRGFDAHTAQVECVVAGAARFGEAWDGVVLR